MPGITLPYQLFLSFALGQGAAPAIEPFAQAITNEAWSLHAVRPPDAFVLAEGVAQGQVAKAAAYAWAKQQGFDTSQMDALVSIANVGPPLGLAYEAWRRGALSDADFETALRRTGLETQWFAALEALKGERLDLGAISTAVHRGIMHDAGLLVTPVPSGPGNVPRIPVSTLDTLAEYAAHGIDAERARVMVADTGLPLALGMMLQLLNRGVVTETDVKVSVSESNVRNEYMDVALALAREILTPHAYAEAELRGVLSHAEAVAGAALSGLNEHDYNVTFANLGRPLTQHQIATGLARGGTYGGDYSAIPDGPYRDAARRSAVRPEYADLYYHNRFSYPSLFQLSRLVEGGTISAATGADWARKSGLAPEVVDALQASWQGGGGGGDPHVTKAQNQLWTTLHRSYLAGKTDDTAAATVLGTLGVAAGAIPGVLHLWQTEAALVRKPLTPAQVKKAYRNGTENPDTGSAWTQDEALAELMALGMSHSDALTFLTE